MRQFFRGKISNLAAMSIALEVCQPTIVIGQNTLPSCQNGQRATWNNCIGSFTNRAGSYEGEFRNGMVSGFGTFKNINGNTYTGFWINARFHGLGVLYKNGIIEQAGVWEDNRFIRSAEIPWLVQKQITQTFERPQQFDSTSKFSKEKNLFTIPIKINNSKETKFSISNEEPYVKIPVDLVENMMELGVINNSDFIGDDGFTSLDGRTLKSGSFRIRQITVSNQTVENVLALVARIGTIPVLGQSFLSKFRHVAIDEGRGEIILVPVKE